MEAIVVLTEAAEMKNVVTKINGGNMEKEKKIFRIQVSKTKKPIFFYLNLAKKHLKMDHDVELCALGTAIPTVIIMAEIVKRNGWGIEKGIMASTIGKEDKEGRVIHKAKLDILLGKAKSGDQSTAEASTSTE
ncbi:Alba DNA/RNA-binding protein [Trifolium repens]|nr:Alba DNA/RNA-binding protein [Trifolium repens]